MSFARESFKSSASSSSNSTSFSPSSTSSSFDGEPSDSPPRQRKRWDQSDQMKMNVLTGIQALTEYIESEALRVSPEGNSKSMIKKLVKARQKAKLRDGNDVCTIVDHIHPHSESDGDVNSNGLNTRNEGRSDLEEQIKVLGIRNLPEKGAFSNSTHSSSNSKGNRNGDEENTVMEHFNDSLLLNKYAATSSADSIITSKILNHFEEYKRLGKKSDVLNSMIETLETLVESDTDLGNKKHIELLTLLYSYQ